MSLSKPKIKRLANIYENAGHAFLASITLPPLINPHGIAQRTLLPMCVGIITTLICWKTSLKLEEKTHA